MPNKFEGLTDVISQINGDGFIDEMHFKVPHAVEEFIQHAEAQAPIRDPCLQRAWIRSLLYADVRFLKSFCDRRPAALKESHLNIAP